MIPNRNNEDSELIHFGLQSGTPNERTIHKLFSGLQRKFH
jgi:hypothetical protein